MIYEKVKLMVDFGKGTVIVACASYKVDEVDEFWYISIKEANQRFDVGQKVEKSAIMLDTNEIYLTFPSRDQMLKVMAALTNKSFEVVLEKYEEAKAKKLEEEG